MSERAKSWLALAVVLLLTAGVFAPAMHYGFLKNWDDGIFILENRHLDFSVDNFKRYGLAHYRNLYTPLPMYSLMVDKACFDLEPFGYHLHNLILHLGGAALLFAILRALRCSACMSALATLIWAVNPQKLESVVWITERKDVQMGLFAFAAFYCFLWSLRHASKTMGDIIGMSVTALFTVMAIFCKPAAVPLVGIYAVWLLCRRDWREAWRNRVLIPIIAGFGATMWAAYMTAQGNPGGLERNIFIWLHNLLWYPASAIVPLFNTNPIYPTVGPVREHLVLLIGAPLAAVALLYYAWRVRQIPWLNILTAVLILGGTILPVMGLWHYTAFEYCDRYNYLVSAVAVGLVALALPAHRYMLSAGCVIVALMIAATWLAMPAWRSDEAIAHACLDRPGRLNRKAVELAASDAFHRTDPAMLEWIAARLSQDKSFFGTPERTGENTVLLMQGYAAYLRDDKAGGDARLAILKRIEAEQGEVKFIRGANYKIVYRYLTTGE